VFALIFLLLLSLCQDKESDKQTIEEHGSAKQDPSCVGMTNGRGILIAGRFLMQSIDCFSEWSSGQAVPCKGGAGVLRLRFLQKVQKRLLL
jgi:hypothetical protein